VVPHLPFLSAHSNPPLLFFGKQKQKSFQLKLLPQLAAQLNSDDGNAQADSVVQFRKLLSIERNPPIQEVIDVGVVPRLVQMLTFQHNPTVQVSVTKNRDNCNNFSFSFSIAIVCFLFDANVFSPNSVQQTLRSID
jgi:hypothetical protein